MRKKKPTAGERMIAGAKQALAFAQGEPDHGCIVHTPEEQAMRQLEAFLAPRIAQAERGELSEKSVEEILAEVREAEKP